MTQTKLLPTYVTSDGERTLQGAPEEVIDALRFSSLYPGKDRHEWMRDAAGRARDQCGAVVSWSSAEEFLEGLVRCGLLMKIVVN